ncbi:metalloendopeptidase [Coemansia helicoidea]|uniref:Metalloendopeptidase n=1 Tax=Coemansia helicoidea TaxID=1286919 RepID=A0ACC1LEQ5_9FUNG|nr:metalloendopeptidase [Coemansia helicoidea]
MASSVIDFGLSPDEIVRGVKDAIREERAAMDAVAGVAGPAFGSVVAPLEAVHAVYTNADEMRKIGSEDRCLVEQLELGFRRSGLLQPPETRERLAAISRRLCDLEAAFARSINESCTEMLFTRDELHGLPDAFFDGRSTEAVRGVEKYAVTTRRPDYQWLLKYAQREATRRAVYVAEAAQCADNTLRLQEMALLRLEEAQLLGYASHSHYVMETLMAKTPQAATEMVSELRVRVMDHARRELAELEALKAADAQGAGEQHRGFFCWDKAYYTRLAKERKHRICEDALMQYFPLGHTTRGMLDIYGRMLGLRITQVDGAPVWHPDVAVYEAWEAGSDEFVGHFYLDLHPREGKYNHAAVWPIRPGFERPDGSRERPVVALVANFPAPTSGAPALLTHRNVVTLMHELGHVFHGLCARTKWARFHGTRVERDFVEAPSQMLENWAWDPAILRRISAHHKTGAPLPDDMVAKLVASRTDGAGLATLCQAFYALYDLAIHSATDASVDVVETYIRMRSDITLLSDDTHVCRIAALSHLASGYSSRLYSYLWADVFSADMFETRFVKEGLDNPATGRDYRDTILRPGGSRSAAESLELFLGRRPNSAAFIKSLGLDPR